MPNSSKPVIKIRAAVSGEAAILTAVAMESKAYWPYSAAQIEAWREGLTISEQLIAESHAYAVECDGRIAGCYVLQPDSSNQEIWALEHVWLLPTFIGCGVGRAMLQHAVNIAAQGGATTMTIDADPHAEAFYQACGAKTVGTVTAPIDGMPERVRPQMILAVPLPE